MEDGKEQEARRARHTRLQPPVRERAGAALSGIGVTPASMPL